MMLEENTGNLHKIIALTGLAFKLLRILITFLSDHLKVEKADFYWCVIYTNDGK